MIREIDGKNYLMVKVSRQENRVIVIRDEPAEGSSARISLLERQELIARNILFLAGKTNAVKTFAVTGQYPLVLADPAVLPEEADPIIFEGYAVVVLAKGKTVQEGVPIPAANAGGMLLRKAEHLDGLFTQNLFLYVGEDPADTSKLTEKQKDKLFAALTGDWCEIAGDERPLSPCIGVPNGSVVAPRLEFLAVREAYVLPGHGSKFLQDFFAKKFNEDNSVYLYFVERDGNPVVFARCDKEGTLLPCRSDEAPSGEVGYEPDETRPSGVSDVVRGLAELVARRLGKA